MLAVYLLKKRENKVSINRKCEGNYMIMTYDFILTAKYNKEFRVQLDNAILSDLNSEICTDIHRLTFCRNLRVVIVTAKSDTSAFRNKIIPKKNHLSGTNENA